MSVPSTSGTRDPKRLPRIPATGPAKSMTAADGSRNSPACVIVAPKP